jgi:DNA-binding HxlR family transcriptional regulator
VQIKRSYREYCGLAKALDLIGERWTLLIVRNLLLGPLRYSDLLRGLPGITTNLLAKRLSEMEWAGLVARIKPAPAAGAGRSYRLTAIGAGLEPAVHALGRWGWQWMERPQSGDHRSLEWLLVALRRRYRGGLELTAELVADQVPYTIRARGAEVAIERGAAAAPDLRITGRGIDLATLFLEGRPPGSKSLSIEGSSSHLPALLAAFDRGDSPSR